MNKKIISLILIISVIFVLFVIPEAKMPYTVEFDELFVSQNGNNLVEMKNGQLDVSVKLKCLSGIANPRITAMLCEGDKNSYIVRDIKFDDSVNFFEGESANVSFSFYCNNAEKEFIKIMGIEHSESSKRKAADIFFPNEDILKLKNIKINGKDIPGFDKNVSEYEFKIPEGTELPLDVEVEKYFDDTEFTVNNITEVPGNIVITSYYKDYEPLKYTVKIEEQGPEVKLLYLSSKSGKPEAYSVKENAQIGDAVHLVDNVRTIVDFGESALEGSTVITTFYGDGLSQYEFYPFEDFLTFSINKSADVYIASYMKGAKGSKYMEWVVDFGELVQKDGKDVQITVGNNKTMFLYKKSFSVIPGTTEEITLQNLGKYGNGMYVVFVKWTDGQEEV